jgi:hypothetical protein
VAYRARDRQPEQGDDSITRIRPSRIPCKRADFGERRVTLSCPSRDRARQGAHRRCTSHLHVDFVRGHARSLLCVAAGLVLSALTYQPPF